MMRDADGPAERHKLLKLVMGAVFAWGSVLALGAALYGYHVESGEVEYAPNLWRGLIVEACVLGFLGIWWLALRQRPRPGA